MPPKKKTKKLIKLKKRVPATTINIKIDNSRRTQARKPAENKPKGHVNLPITYFSQFQPARTVITDQRPNQGFNTTDMYQSQFKNYFDGKLDDMEKRILEQSEKKNTAPPKPEMAKPGAYNRVSDYDDNLIMENRKPKAPPPNRTNIVSNSNLEDNPFIKAGWKPSTFTTDDFNVDYKTTTITQVKSKSPPTIFDAPPINLPQTTVMPLPVAETKDTEDIPVVGEVEEFDEDRIADNVIQKRKEEEENALIQQFNQLKNKYKVNSEYSRKELERLKVLNDYMEAFKRTSRFKKYDEQLNTVKTWSSGKLRTGIGKLEA